MKRKLIGRNNTVENNISPNAKMPQQNDKKKTQYCKCKLQSSLQLYSLKVVIVRTCVQCILINKSVCKRVCTSFVWLCLFFFF